MPFFVEEANSRPQTTSKSMFAAVKPCIRLSACRSHSARILQGFCRGSARVLQGFCKDSARILQVICRGSARVLQVISSAWRAVLIPNLRSDSARVLQILQINYFCR